MTPHILIFNDNLCGLITAYRLTHYGFRVTILHLRQESGSHPFITREPGASFAATSHSSEEPGCAQVPLILFGCYHHTQSLFQEINFDQAFLPSRQVAMEFGPSGGRDALSYAPWPAFFPPILRLPFLRELSWSDRWQIMNFLEKKWESTPNTEAGSDTVSVDSWLHSAKQSPQAREVVWNPLCRFLLGCDITEASLEYFLTMLSKICFPPSQHSKIFLLPPLVVDGLHHRLRDILRHKGVAFHTVTHQPHVQIDGQGVRAIGSTEGKSLTADAYVSTIAPTDLLRLLPERALARFSSFSHLSELRQNSGIALQVRLPGVFRLPG